VNDAEQRTPVGTTAVEQDADAALAELMRDDRWRSRFKKDFADAFGPAAKDYRP